MKLSPQEQRELADMARSRGRTYYQQQRFSRDNGAIEGVKNSWGTFAWAAIVIIAMFIIATIAQHIDDRPFVFWGAIACCLFVISVWNMFWANWSIAGLSFVTVLVICVIVNFP